MSGEIREYWDHPTRGEAILIYSVTRNGNHMIRWVTNEHSDETAYFTIEAARKRWRFLRLTSEAAGFVRRPAAPAVRVETERNSANGLARVTVHVDGVKQDSMIVATPQQERQARMVFGRQYGRGPYHRDLA